MLQVLYATIRSQSFYLTWRETDLIPLLLANFLQLLCTHVQHRYDWLGAEHGLQTKLVRIKLDPNKLSTRIEHGPILIPALPRPALACFRHKEHPRGSSLNIASQRQTLRTFAIGSFEMKRLSSLLPSIRWVPHDIESPASSKKEIERAKRSRLSVKSASRLNHGALRKRKSVISLTDDVDEDLSAKTDPQGRSPFFTKLPIEIRKMVYEYVIGEETIHLLFAKKSFSHFVCPGTEEEEECDCKVLVGGAHCQRLSSACVRMLVVCRRM